MFFNKKPSRPTSEDAAWRLLALRSVAIYTFVSPPPDMLADWKKNWPEDQWRQFIGECEQKAQEFRRPLQSTGIWDRLTPREKECLGANAATMTERQQIDGVWRLESAQALMWALYMLPSLPHFDTQANPDILKQLQAQDTPQFVNRAKLRPQSEIEHVRGIAETWHWRSRTRQLVEKNHPFPAQPQLKAAGIDSFPDLVAFTARRMVQDGEMPNEIGGDFPAMGKPYRDLSSDEWSTVTSITVERHRALNWLCGHAPGNKWDETPTDT